MKKVFVLFSMLVCLAVATAAHAEDCDNLWKVSGCIVTGSAVSPLLTTLGASQNREVYVARLKDDAADYVSSPDGSVMGPFLQDAIAQIRANDSTAETVSDRDLALKILSLN
jgi:uncharacterized protein (TIGR02448 family)